MSYRSEKRLYLTPDGEVTDDPAEAAELLVAEGGELDAEAVQLHNLDVDDRAKAIKGPPANKARKRAANKGLEGS